MQRLRELEKAYFGSEKPVSAEYFKFWKNGIDQNLNSDILFEICKYMGSLMGLITTDLRKRWKREGISISYGLFCNKKGFPENLEKYVTKIVTIEMPKLEIISKFTNLKTVYFVETDDVYPLRRNRIMFGYEEINILKGVKTIILDYEVYTTTQFSRDSGMLYNKISIYKDGWLLPYHNFISVVNTKTNHLPDTLEYGFVKINPDIEYNLHFRDLIYVYLHLNDLNRSEIADFKLKTVMGYDITVLDYYENVIKILYIELGLKTAGVFLGTTWKHIILNSTELTIASYCSNKLRKIRN